MKNLVIEVSKIPPGGLAVDSPLQPEAVHLEGEKAFSLVSGRLQVRLEKGDEESVHVRGHLDARLKLECGRCLEPFEMDLDQDLELFFLSHVADQVEEEDEVELSDHDMVVAYYRDNRLDLGEAVREQILLGLPLKGLCRQDCQGLCPHCGVNRNATACACTIEEAEDPRLAPLRKLFEKH